MYKNLVIKSSGSTTLVGSLKLAITVLILNCCVLIGHAQESVDPDPKAFKFWNDFEAESVMNVNHEQWQSLLTKYVDDEHTSGINRFDYGAVTDEDKTLLKDYLDYLQLLEPRQLNQAEAKAYWLNFYNAILVDDILDAFEIDSISSVRQIRSGAFRPWPWTRNAVEVVMQKMSLNDIEHNIIRPMFQDPRIHFALAKGSLGGASLLKVAFDGDNNEELLNQAEQDFLSHSRGVNIQASDGLTLNSMFEWYVEDFGGSQAQVLAYIAERLDPQGSPPLLQADTVNYAYDWSINAPVE